MEYLDVLDYQYLVFINWLLLFLFWSSLCHC